MPRPARPWFRFYVEAVHDRKLRRLKPEQRWLFVACLAAARQSCEPGVLLVGDDDPMTITDMADFAGMPQRDVAQGMAALVRAGVLDMDTETETWFVPAWSDRQYESDDVTARTRKHRKERSNDVPGNVPGTSVGTPPETEAETDTETPPTPRSDLDLIVEGVFAKALARKQEAGEIRSVDGFRRWWDDNDGIGARKRAAWFVEHYAMPSLSHYVDATCSTTVPRWAGSMLRQGETA